MYPRQEPQVGQLDHFDHIAMIELDTLDYEPLFQRIYYYSMRHVKVIKHHFTA